MGHSVRLELASNGLLIITPYNLPGFCLSSVEQSKNTTKPFFFFFFKSFSFILKREKDMIVNHFTHGVIVIVVGNGYGDASSNPGRDCISHSTNTLGKGVNPIILPPAIGK